MSKKKDLHMTKTFTMEELNKMVDNGIPKSQKANARRLLQSANNLLPEGEKLILEGDEEHAYIIYMRYLELVQIIKKTSEFEKDKGYFQKMLGKHKIEDVIETCEKLSGSLKVRYDVAKEARKCEQAEHEKEISEATENENLRIAQKKAAAKPDPLTSKMNGVVKGNSTTPEGKKYTGDITVSELKSLIEQKSTKLLILDCRSNSSFASNHVNHPNCISIPDDALIRGNSAGKITDKLKQKYPESYILWNKRQTFDIIVLYDWNSSFNNMSDCLQILYDAITKWDSSKCNLPVVLQGGMRNMYYSYPTSLTNPSNENEENKKVEDVTNAVKKLDLVSYPDFDDEAKISPLSNSHPTIYNNISKDSNSINSHSNSNNNFSNESIVSLQIDRSNKPQSKYSNKMSNGMSSSTDVSKNPSACNGVTQESDHQLPNVDSGDIKAKIENVNAALDEIINVHQATIKTEEEYRDLKQTNHPDVIKMMAAKEMELELLKSKVEAREKAYEILKAEHEEMKQREQARLTLPRIRSKPEELEMERKVEKKAQLDEYVNKLRLERKQKEQEQKLALESTKLPPIVSSNSNLENKSFTPTKSMMSSSAGSNVLLRPISQDASPISTMKLKDESSDSPRSSLLKRSHSHPNLAQQSVNEDDEGLESQNAAGGTPNINRNLKPVAIRPMASETYGARRREFQVVSSTEKQKTGLKNLGNTCYMNSVIQCIYHTPQLTAYFMNDEYKANWRLGRGPTKGEATEEVAAAVREMNLGHRSIALNDLKLVVGRYRNTFSGYEQQDSHEFLTFLLDWMHEELNVQTKTPLKEQKNDGISDTEAASLAWNDFLASNQSKISELFCGQQKSCVKCLNCDKESVTFEPFFVLSVPIPSSSKKCDIQQCIELYTSAEELPGYNCVHCKTTGKATKKIDLWRLPPYLIIHLQRFYFDGWWKKRLTEVDFPVDNFDLTRNVKGRQTGDRRFPCPQFQLYGVSNHYGTMDGGHYTAYCRKGQWYKFDDQSVESISPRDVCTPAAYILFYGNNSP